MNAPTNRIIVAVADEDVEAMLRFSVDEALRSGAELHLVHVLYLPGVMLPETYAVAYSSAKEYAVGLLDHAVEVATAMGDGRVRVTSELVERSGSAVHDLVSRSADARLLVLKHRQVEGLHRLTTTSTTLGVCARAHTPVVSVPAHWQPAEPAFGRVTVGVSNPVRADEALRAGFEVARQRGSRLRVVHSWWLANGYDSAVVDDDMRRDFSTRFRQEIAPHLEKLQQGFPEVEVDVLVFHAEPAVGIMRAAEDSDVVIVGRRHWALPVGSHVGAVTRALLRAVTCPVVVVETSPHADEPEKSGPGRQVQVTL